MKTQLDTDIDWDDFCNNDYEDDINNKIEQSDSNNSEKLKEIPESTNIYISTKTKISYLSHPIDLKKTFWNLPISPYHTANNCIIKKQMKFNSSNETEVEELQTILNEQIHWEQDIIIRIVNPEGRIKFKDIRKISIGLCKKDILSYRTKKKSAFYNCFVLILRIKFNNVFREIHIKVFNTGKLEIPGIQSDNLLEEVLDLLIYYLKPISNNDIRYIPEKNETVLINSNFNCGFFINRDKLYDILRYKYHINSTYDPCSYPGIQCKFYYNIDTNEPQRGQQPIDNLNSYIKLSFMIFRTGSVLIVGKCDEYTLNNIYIYIKNLLKEEYNIINTIQINKIDNIIKKKKIRRKTILLK
jgi:TATA-box binding protein (TBP) (component of TFIID and TFIIIB)